MKTGIIDVGGGFRDIYGAGILDYFLDNNISFDKCYGISAGSANLSTFIANQPGRAKKFYVDYSFRKEYASMSNFVKTRNYIDLDYAYSILSNSDGEDPLDYEAFEASSCDFTVVACNAITGDTKYFLKKDLKKDNYDPLKASSSLPVFGRPYVINGIPYYDGGMADPVPIEKAFNDGCDKVVLILTKPFDFIREAKSDRKLAQILRHNYPLAAHRLFIRYKTYNDEVDLAKEYMKQGKVCILAPENLYGISTVTKTLDGLENFYNEGYEDGKKVKEFLDIK